jgi:hypothetical protein
MAQPIQNQRLATTRLNVQNVDPTRSRENPKCPKPLTQQAAPRTILSEPNQDTKKFPTLLPTRGLVFGKVRWIGTTSPLIEHVFAPPSLLAFVGPTEQAFDFKNTL